MLAASGQDKVRANNGYIKPFSVGLGGDVFLVKTYTGVFLGLGGGVVTENLLMGLNLTPWSMLLLFLLVAFVAGFLLDWISVLLIFVPIFVPIVIKLGFDPIWF